MTLAPEVEALVRAEQVRQGGRFIRGVTDLDEYLERLGSRAEIVAHLEAGRCRGMIAYYCNDVASGAAYVSLVVVDPADRGRGIGGALLSWVLGVARARQFRTCRLEVQRDNAAARAFYAGHGFSVVEALGDRDLLEATL